MTPNGADCSFSFLCLLPYRLCAGLVLELCGSDLYYAEGHGYGHFLAVHGI